MIKDFVSCDIFDIVVDEKLRKLASEPVNEDLIDKNKYANGAAYIPDSIYKRILNKITNSRWSFVPHSWEEKDDGSGKKFVQYIGILIVPGFGYHTGIGTAMMNKKDNQNALSAAKTYAFKNACKEMGLAPNVDDKDYDPDESVFEFDDEEFEEPPKKAPKKTAKKTATTKKKAAPSKKKEKPELTIEERIEEVRNAYELEDEDDFVAFVQIWDEEIMDTEDMSDKDWKEFLDYLEDNKDEFDDF